MSKNKTFTGPLAEHIRNFLNEKRTLGYKYEEQERVFSVLDRMSQQFDCSNGLPKDLGSKLETEDAGTACYPDPYFCRIFDQTRNPCVPG